MRISGVNHCVGLTIRSACTALMLVCSLGCSSPASAAPESKLWAEFKTFCVDTGLRLDAIKSKVGALKMSVVSQINTETPFPMHKTIWGYVVSGKRMVVEAGVMHMPAAQGTSAYDGTLCEVAATADYDATVALVREFAGVKPYTTASDSVLFDYSDNGSTHTFLDVDDGAAVLAAQTNGTSRILEARDVEGNVYISLTRQQLATDPQR